MSPKLLRRQLRRQVIEAYGGACACCGETTIEFLELDHVHNNGKAARKLYGCAYRRAQLVGYPGCYQILCANCHAAKTRYGRCPHRAGAPRRHWPIRRTRRRGSLPSRLPPSRPITAIELSAVAGSRSTRSA